MINTSLILIRLALTKKASSRIQYILFHFRSYWRGWRPLVTPWAGCIKEGIEPRISQKWFFPSLAQVSLSLSALFFFSCPVSAFIVLIVIIIIIMDIYLQRVFIIAVVMNTNLDILISKNFSLVLCFASRFCSLLVACPFFLSLLMTLCVEGYPTHIISPALLLAFASLSLPSDDIISVEGYPTHIISPALLLAFASLSLSLLMTL